MTKQRLTKLLFGIGGLVLVVAFAGWILGRNPDVREWSDADKHALSEFEALGSSHILRIAEADEPGERLVLCLTFVRKSDRTPLSNEEISFYHTNADGDYEPKAANDETTARLNGSATTDGRGRMMIETILPGDYGSSSDTRHIHLSVPSARPVAYDIHFRQYSTFMLRRFVANSDQHFLADLKRNDDDELIAFLTIECKFNPAG